MLYEVITGLEDADCLSLDSPFDYRNHALLWVPEGMTEPRDPRFLDCMLEQVLPVLVITSYSIHYTKLYEHGGTGVS